MNDIDSSENGKIIRVVNVDGDPISVERRVNELLDVGYRINSDLMPWTPTGTNATVFVQQLVLYEGDQYGSITT